MLRRVLRSAAWLLAWSLLLFVLLHQMPGGLEEQISRSHPELPAAEIERRLSLEGLDRPLVARYACWWLGDGAPGCAWWPGGDGLVFGDLGRSVVHGTSVTTLLRQRVPRTLRLMVPAFLIAGVLSLVLGVWVGARPKSLAAQFCQAVAFSGVALPIHWVCLLLVAVFAVGLGWFPSGGMTGSDPNSIWQHILHLVLPVSVLVLFYLSRWMRLVVPAVVEQLQAPHVEAARARGLSERRILWAHVLPGALLPFVTIVGQSAPSLFSGAVVVERVFAYPGVGMLIFESVEEHDYLVAVVLFLVSAAITYSFVALVDRTLMLIDPRVRFGSRQ